MNKQAEPLQLQIFDRAARAYVPHKTAALLGAVGFETARSLANGKPWRICKADRPLKPRYMVPRRTASDRDKDEIIREYLEWAKSKGLTRVHAYLGLSGSLARARGFDVHTVDPAEQFAVIETTDEDATP